MGVEKLWDLYTVDAIAVSLCAYIIQRGSYSRLSILTCHTDLASHGGIYLHYISPENLWFYDPSGNVYLQSLGE
jgi:hypothetical protein